MLEIVVEGTVGAGKTTLVEILEKERGMKGFYEMGDELADQILERYYKDKHRWCLTMELYFLHKRFLQVREASQTDRAVMDRSMTGDFVFVKMQKQFGFLQPIEYSVYENFYKTMVQILPLPKLLVYIKCSVETALRRIEKRGRVYEVSVERSYWEQLNYYYDMTFLDGSNHNILVVDGDQIDFVENDSHRALVLNAIDRCMNSNGIYILDETGLRYQVNWYNNNA
ncbi:deoxynucleoside kinase [Pseudothermotoga sp. U03pept]|uniref:deoxynucleoside kinase n=1 Tax=Pseudothermotoga sp. U03pept TaxID=3447012 RepID=UPI003F0FC429